MKRLILGAALALGVSLPAAGQTVDSCRSVAAITDIIFANNPGALVNGDYEASSVKELVDFINIGIEPQTDYKPDEVVIYGRPGPYGHVIGLFAVGCVIDTVEWRRRDNRLALFLALAKPYGGRRL